MKSFILILFPFLFWGVDLKIGFSFWLSSSLIIAMIRTEIQLNVLKVIAASKSKQ